MKIKKICLKFILLGIMLGILYIPGLFIYTRFFLPQYELYDHILTYKDNVYIGRNSFSQSDKENLGKTIGIAFYGERDLNDYIFPVWVKEYIDDKEHNRVFVIGLMDLGTVYDKAVK